MANTVIEMAVVKLAEGKTEEQLVAASNDVRDGFLSSQPGFLGHDLVRTEDGSFADIVRWQSEEAAQNAMMQAEKSPVCGAYFSVIAFDPEAPQSGISHFAVLSSSSH